MQEQKKLKKTGQGHKGDEGGGKKLNKRKRRRKRS